VGRGGGDFFAIFGANALGEFSGVITLLLRLLAGDLGYGLGEVVFGGGVFVIVVAYIRARLSGGVHWVH